MSLLRLCSESKLWLEDNAVKRCHIGAQLSAQWKAFKKTKRIKFSLPFLVILFGLLSFFIYLNESFGIIKQSFAAFYELQYSLLLFGSFFLLLLPSWLLGYRCHKKTFNFLISWEFLLGLGLLTSFSFLFFENQSFALNKEALSSFAAISTLFSFLLFLRTQESLSLSKQLGAFENALSKEIDFSLSMNRFRDDLQSEERKLLLLFFGLALLAASLLFYFSNSILSPVIVPLALLPICLPITQAYGSRTFLKLASLKVAISGLSNFRTISKKTHFRFHQNGVLLKPEAKVAQMWFDHSSSFEENELRLFLKILVQNSDHPLSTALRNELNSINIADKQRLTQSVERIPYEGLELFMRDELGKEFFIELKNIATTKVRSHDRTTEANRVIEANIEQKNVVSALSINRRIVAVISYQQDTKEGAEDLFAKLQEHEKNCSILSSSHENSLRFPKEFFKQASFGLLKPERTHQIACWNERDPNVIELRAAWDHSETEQDSVVFASEALAKSFQLQEQVSIFSENLNTFSELLKRSKNFDQSLKRMQIFAVLSSLAVLFSPSLMTAWFCSFCACSLIIFSYLHPRDA